MAKIETAKEIVGRVVIMRGAPCSGKSTIVEDQWPGATICSADHFHMQEGVYRFDITRQQEGHNFCWIKFSNAIVRRDHLIVVDNSNIALDEAGAFWRPAIAEGYQVEVVTVRCKLATLLERNAQRTDKRLPPEIIGMYVERMRVMDALIPAYWKHRYIDT